MCTFIKIIRHAKKVTASYFLYLKPTNMSWLVWSVTIPLNIPKFTFRKPKQSRYQKTIIRWKKYKKAQKLSKQAWECFKKFYQREDMIVQAMLLYSTWASNYTKTVTKKNLRLVNSKRKNRTTLFINLLTTKCNLDNKNNFIRSANSFVKSKWSRPRQVCYNIVWFGLAINILFVVISMQSFYNLSINTSNIAYTALGLWLFVIVVYETLKLKK